MKLKKTLAGQALKAVFTLNRYLYNFTCLNPSHYLDLFDKLVSPILSYGSEVWGFHKAISIETVHLQFCKRTLGVKQSTQNDFIYGELGRVDFQTQRYLHIIKYWLKVARSDDNKYIKTVYRMMLNDMEQRPMKQNWASAVKNLLSRLGFLDVWLSQGVEHISAFLAALKLRLHDIFKQDWHARIENSSRARCYLTFAVFEYQKYLNVLPTDKYRR